MVLVTIVKPSGEVCVMDLKEEEYQRLNSDTGFVQDLLDLGEVENNQVQDSNLTNNHDEGNIQELSQEQVDLEEKFVWQHKSIMLLLEEYRKRIEKFRNPKFKKKTLWLEISKIMRENGYPIDSDGVDKKLRNMKATFRKILDNNHKKKTTGTGRIHWEYFQIMEDIFQEDKTVNDVPVMLSISELTTKPESDFSARSSSPVKSPLPVTPPLSFGSNITDNSELLVSSSPSFANCSTTSKKRRKAKELDKFRKRQLEIEEEKLIELKKLRKSIEENNKIQRDKLKLLQQMVSSNRVELKYT